LYIALANAISNAVTAAQVVLGGTAISNIILSMILYD
jgi:hypothetical protein